MTLPDLQASTEGDLRWHGTDRFAWRTKTLSRRSDRGAQASQTTEAVLVRLGDTLLRSSVVRRDDGRLQRVVEIRKGPSPSEAQRSWDTGLGPRPCLPIAGGLSAVGGGWTVTAPGRIAAVNSRPRYEVVLADDGLPSEVRRMAVWTYQGRVASGALSIPKTATMETRGGSLQMVERFEFLSVTDRPKPITADEVPWRQEGVLVVDHRVAPPAVFEEGEIPKLARQRPDLNLDALLEESKKRSKAYSERMGGRVEHGRAWSFRQPGTGTAVTIAGLGLFATGFVLIRRLRQAR